MLSFEGFVTLWYGEMDSRNSQKSTCMGTIGPTGAEIELPRVYQELPRVVILMPREDGKVPRVLLASAVESKQF